MLSRPDDSLFPLVAAWQSAAGERRQEARADHGGLAAARRPDDADQRSPGQPGDEFRDELLPAEEEVRVLDVEAREPLERTVLQVDRPLAPEPAECPLEVDDVARQGCLSRTPLLPAGLGPASRLLEALARLGPEQLLHRFVYAQRHASGLRAQLEEGQGRGSL